MIRTRQALSQTSGRPFLTDGGIETTPIFLEGLELPLFAAFHLLRPKQGEAALTKYFRTYAELARRHRTGLVLETATWRASADWGDKLGYSAGELAQANRRSVAMLETIRAEYETPDTPVVVSLTVETDGALPAGQPLGDAVSQIDAATTGYPSYFMIDCAHPDHFVRAVDRDEPWRDRIRGLRANASRMSHAELNEAPGLDAGDPEALGRDDALLTSRHPKHLNVVGGCCGTDHRHVDRMALSCRPLFQGGGRRRLTRKSAAHRPTRRLAAQRKPPWSA